MAALLAQVTAQPALAEQVQRIRREAAVPLRAPQPRRLQVRLLCGLVLFVSTWYCAPRGGKRGTAPSVEQQAGLYPELAALGFGKGCSPALQYTVARIVALSPSIAVAQKELARQGIDLDPEGRPPDCRTVGNADVGVAAAGTAGVAGGSASCRERTGRTARGRANRRRTGPPAGKPDPLAETAAQRATGEVRHAVARTEGAHHLRDRRAGEDDQEASAAADRRDPAGAGSSGGIGRVSSAPLGSGPGGVGGLRVGWGALDLGPAGLDRAACGTRSVADGACAGFLSRGASRQSGVADPGLGREAAAGNLWPVAQTAEEQPLGGGGRCS